MSDVNITGVNGVPPEDWATEFTLLKILQALNIGGKQTKSNSKLQLDILRSLAKDSSTGSSQLNELKRISQDTAKNTNEGVKEAKKQSLANAAANKAGFNTSGGAVKSKTDMFTSDGMLGKAIGGLAVVIDNVIDALMAATDGYNKAYKGGAIFAEMAAGQDESFKAFTQAAADMQIPLSEMGDIAAKFPAAMNQMGIGKMSEMMVNLRGKMKQFGVTATESGEFIGSLTEQYRALGMLDQLNGERGNEITEKAFETTKRFAQVLGMSTQRLQEEIAMKAKDRAARMAMFNVAENVKGLFTKTLMSIENIPEIGDALNEALVNPSAMVGEKLAQLQMIAGVEGAEAVKDLAVKFKNGSASQEDVVKMLKTLAREGKKLPDEVSSMLMKAGMDASVSLKTGIDQAVDQFDKTAKDSGDSHLAMYQNIDSIGKGVKSMWENAMSDFLSPETMKVINEGLALFAGALKELTLSLKEFMTGLGDKDAMKGMFTNAFEWMSDIPGKMTKMFDDADYILSKLLAKLESPTGTYTKKEHEANKMVEEAEAMGLDASRLKQTNEDVTTGKLFSGSWKNTTELRDDEVARLKAQLADSKAAVAKREQQLTVIKATRQAEDAKNTTNLVDKKAGMPAQMPADFSGGTDTLNSDLSNQTGYVVRVQENQAQSLDEMVYLLRQLVDKE